MSFAYLHECFPDPNKTFVYREVQAMHELGMEPAVFSIRRPTEEESARMEAFSLPVEYLPEEGELRDMVERERGGFSARQRRALSHWRAQKGDSTRIFEALWLGRELRRRGLRHVHAHFAGLAARTAWLLREVWGIGYSFTGHADDIFSPEQKPIDLARLVRDARFIATETDYSRQRLEQEYPPARGKTYRVFNGLAAFPEAGSAETDGPARIVSVGRLVEKKGFPELLAACALLRERGSHFHCDIIGAGPLEATLQTQIEESGLGDLVTLHGAQPQDVVRNFLSRARAFALAARQEGDGGSDNLPTVIMEAMAYGLPVVSTRIAGIPEMVDPGETGALVSARDVPSFAEALATYLRDRNLAREHGRSGQARCRQKFDVRRSAAELAVLLARHTTVIPPESATQHDSRLALSWWERFARRIRPRR